MTVPTTGFSPRLGLALAAGMAGLVLAVGVTAATYVGWLGPAKASAPVGESDLSAAPLAALDGSAATMPQVVLVPVTPSGPSVASGVPAAPVEAPAARPLPPELQETQRERRDRTGLGAGAERSSRGLARIARRHSDDD
jgi:hypothetical protein